MRRLLPALALAIGLLALGPGRSAAESPAATTAPLYGIVEGGRLVRLDPGTLAPVSGGGLRIGSLQFLVRSPDGRLAAFGQFPDTKVRIVDLAGARFRSTIDLGVDAKWRIRAYAWPTADRLIVLVQRNRGPYNNIVDVRRILVVDPVAGRVIARRPFGEVSAIREDAAVEDKLVLVLGRADGHSGNVRLAVVDNEGRSRAVSFSMGPVRGRFFPALALEPSGQRAYFVAAGAPVAEVDLATLDVMKHPVTGGDALFAAAPFALRRAVWVGEGALAVAGENVGHRRGVEVTQPLGVAVVDTTTWQARVLDRAASGVTTADGSVLAYGFRIDYEGGHQRMAGLGVRAYDANGTFRWQRFAGKTASPWPVRDRVLVNVTPPFRPSRSPVDMRGATHVLDLTNGRDVTKASPRRVFVLPDVPTASRGLDTAARDPALQVQGDGAAFRATVRDDVARVAAVLVDGSELTLAADRGSVSYEAPDPAHAVRLLHAYVGGQLVSSVSLAVDCGGTQGPCAAPIAQQAQPEYAFFANLPAGATTLARIDPRTLLPVGRRLVIRPGFQPSYGRSPDGRYLAVADRDRPSLRVIDLQELRVVRTVDLGGTPASSARVVAWLSRDRLAALTQRLSEPTRRYVRDRAIVFVDPLTGRVLGRRPITNKLAMHGAQVAGGRLAVLLRSSEGQGSTNTLVVADSGGDVRAARIEVGRRPGGALQWTGFALEPSGRRAFIFRSALRQDTQPVIEVDLDTMRATPHQLDVLDSQLEPPTGGFFVGPVASPFGDHTILAMTIIAATTKMHGETYPAGGVFAIDTESWTARRVASEATYFRTRGDRLVTYGFGRVGLGVTVYDDAGKALQHLYDGRRFNNVQLAGGYGHVLLGPPRTKRLVFDLRTGKPLGMLPRLKRYVVVLDPPPTAGPARRLSAANAPAAGGEDPAAFDRAERPSDALPAWYAGRVRPVGRVTESRLVARYVDGRDRVYRLFVYHARSAAGLQTCTALIGPSGAGGGCSPSPLFRAGRPRIVSGGGGVLYGLVAPGVAAVRAQAPHGRRTMQLTADGGFIHDCHRHNGCHCVISALYTYDASGNQIDRLDQPSLGCSWRPRLPRAADHSHVATAIDPRTGRVLFRAAPKRRGDGMCYVSYVTQSAGCSLRSAHGTTIQGGASPFGYTFDRRAVSADVKLVSGRRVHLRFHRFAGRIGAAFFFAPEPLAAPVRYLFVRDRAGTVIFRANLRRLG